MISSRSDNFSIPDGNGKFITLRDARHLLKEQLEQAKFLGGNMVEVWINETEHGRQNNNAWDECIEQARECDLFITLYDGNPGWERKGSGLGVCHAEFDAAFNTAPQKVQVVRLPGAKLHQTDPGRRFLDALTKAHRFETHVKSDWVELQNKIHSLVRDMILRAAHEGVRDFHKSGLNTGPALARPIHRAS